MVKSARNVVSYYFKPLPAARGYFDDSMITTSHNLETFADKGRYSSPEFAWNMSVGVTG